MPILHPPNTLTQTLNWGSFPCHTVCYHHHSLHTSSYYSFSSPISDKDAVQATEEAPYGSGLREVGAGSATKTGTKWGPAYLGAPTWTAEGLPRSCVVKGGTRIPSSRISGHHHCLSRAGWWLKPLMLNGRSGPTDWPNSS